MQDRMPGRARHRRRRHGRGPRGPLAWPPVPAMASRAERFDEIVVGHASRLEQTWGRPFPPVQFAVEDVPPGDPAPWEHSEVPLGRLLAGDGRDPARIVIYRRPVETRVDGTRELSALVGEVVTEQVSALLGVRPDEIDPGYEP